MLKKVTETRTAEDTRSGKKRDCAYSVEKENLYREKSDVRHVQLETKLIQQITGKGNCVMRFEKIGDLIYGRAAILQLLWKRD